MSTISYQNPGPAREEIDRWPRPLVLEFGTGWCEHCRRAKSSIESALSKTPHVEHVKVEDGPGRPLGRSFKVKLWPTLIFVQNGVEIARVVRPNDQDEVEQGLQKMAPAP